MLRASHIKPWRACNNEERLDHFNGLLLMPNLDLAFDNGLITFNKEGEIIISDILSNSDADLLGLKSNIRVKLNPRHQPYMQYHRESIFRK
jgi:predicted restriction endonuclease